ncbi:MAG: hypothetical protein AAFR82_07985 [Pseudomonadota bacterium]
MTLTKARTALLEIEELMRQTLVSGPRILCLIAAAALLSTPALARDVTVYGGGKSKTYTSQEDDRPRVIAYGQERQTAMDKRVKRFVLERKVQSIVQTRDGDEARETSDAMLRVILRGDREAQRQYSYNFPYHGRSADFYARLERKLSERKAGVRVYRQSILDKTSDADLDRIAEALDETE